MKQKHKYCTIDLRVMDQYISTSSGISMAHLMQELRDHLNAKGHAAGQPTRNLHEMPVDNGQQEAEVNE